jgi:hypothetical protein
MRNQIHLQRVHVQRVDQLNLGDHNWVGFDSWSNWRCGDSRWELCIELLEIEGLVAPGPKLRPPGEYIGTSERKSRLYFVVWCGKPIPGNEHGIRHRQDCLANPNVAAAFGGSHIWNHRASVPIEEGGAELLDGTGGGSSGKETL